MQTTKHSQTNQALLTICAPNAMNSTWLNDGSVRYGGISGDAIGQGPFSVWQNAKGGSTGKIDANFTGTKLASKASHGLKLLNKPKLIQQTIDFDLAVLDQKSPLASITKAWLAHNKHEPQLPLHMMMAVYADSAEAIAHGEYNQTNIISVDEEKGHITLAQQLKTGQYLCWALRDQKSAKADLLSTTQELIQALGEMPAFGLLFSCIGRGPFYDGIDHDLKVFTKDSAMPLDSGL